VTSLLSSRPRPARWLLAAVAALLVVGSTSCDPTTRPPAATVNGRDISTSQVMQLLADRASLPGDQTGLKGAGQGTYTTNAFAETLDRLVYLDVLRAELARRHLRVTRADRARAESSLTQSAGAGQVAKLRPHLKQFVVDFDAAQMVLQKEVGKGATSREAAAKAQYDRIKATTPAQLQQVCVTGAVFTSSADASKAKAKVAAGATLTAAVQGISVQQLITKESCAGASQLPPELNAAKIGEYVGPISSQQAFLLLRVEHRRLATYDEVKAQLLQNIPDPGQAAVSTLVAKVLTKAKIEVDPRFGRWNAKAGRVDPPAGAAPATTTTAPAAPAPSSGGSSSSGSGTGSGSPPASSTPAG
jgi:hypothetical protein